MAGRYKDHFEIATRNIERTLRNAKNEPEVKDNGFSFWKWKLDQFVTFDKSHNLGIMAYDKLSYKYKKEIQEFFERNASPSTVVSFLKAKDEDTPRQSGMLNREEYLKNKAIIDAKARGEYVKPGKEPKKPKVVEIIQALYGLQDIKFIDITSKIKIGEKVNNELAGEDPCPKKKKNVIVRAKVDGIEGDFTFTEGKKIVF